ncbi:hypothetical protein EPUS_07110 [Endocarpon pusillum Z07020]|uniref:Uncharacterized protein n=1 Tax=Endocarpon pusillum (strain Z07020 / HMAS-L-300199) TaxID=1263415 RepID=U1GM80_ENDPU|nr:uncharacterized protein EPUS_07110 [Endocarpon pusillum Z07020]ERF73016.1 hypothetical protein EPUS_07110 [Endocarpon pusillum Z07020]
MGFGLSDIISCATLAWHIYNIGFSKYESAKQEYADFGNDIRRFAEGLASIRDAVEKAQEQMPSLRSHEWDLSTFQSIVGDFAGTTKQCEDLVLRNSKFERDGLGFVRNISWSLGLAERVRSLRIRVSFHCSKVIFLLKPLELKIYADIQQRIILMHGDLVGRLNEIKGLLLGDVREETGTTRLPLSALPLVPEYLSEKFKATAMDTRPIEPFPLAEGIDAVAFYFEESTRKFRSFAPLMLTPEPTQYLNLMKCVWIIEKIKSHPSFDLACKDILWKTYVHELESKIISETERFATAESPLQAPQPSDILREPEGNFNIWVDFGDADPFPTLTEPDGFEQKIFEAPLPDVSQSRKQDIMVFRLDETRLRLVRVVTSTISKHKEVEGHEIDAQKVHFVPFYAFPKKSDSALSIGWRATGCDQRSQALTFNHISHLHQLQQAITNFGVVHDSEGVAEVRIKESSFMSGIKTIGTSGRVQIWTHRAPQSPLRFPLVADTVLSHGSSPQDSISPSSAQRAISPNGAGHDSTSTEFSSQAPSTDSWAKTYAASENPSSEIQQAGRRALLRYPVSSQIVIFAASMVDGKETTRFISIPVTEITRLSPGNCDCNKPSKSCLRIVIKCANKLDVKIYDTEGHDERWNLAVLRSPEHIDVRQGLEVIKGAKFVTLDFESAENREDFTNAFETASQIMQNRVESYWRDKGKLSKQFVKPHYNIAPR